MNLWAFLLGTLLVVLTLWESFETMILPRAIMRAGRVTHVFYRTTHWAKRGLAKRIPWRALRETVLSAYGPLSLLALVVLWALLIIVGFGLIQYGIHTQFKESSEPGNLTNMMYFSGTTFFTLGYGDLTPQGGLPRALAVAEAGIGFGMLASVIGYLPVLYQAFSNREAAILRLANRCGGEVDGVALVARYARTGNHEGLASTLEDLEGWIAELLETTVSYPMLAFYRSQRDDRSWIGAMTAVLDATVILQLRTETPWSPRLVDQAELTYAIAQRAMQAMTTALHQRPDPALRRHRDFAALRARLEPSGIRLSPDGEAQWEELAGRYEPEAECLAKFLSLQVPAWPASGVAPKIDARPPGRRSPSRL